LPWPPSVNHYWKTRGQRRFLSPHAKAWMEEALWILRACHVRFDKPVKVKMFLSPPDRRVRDGDNIEKPIYDALKKSGVIPDDSLKWVRQSCREVMDSHEGYVLVIVEEA